jgi:hypothetical protein
MRSALVARAAQELGWRLTLGERFDARPDVIYVGKIGGNLVDSRGHLWLRYIKNLHASGCRVIIDYTDHYCGFDGVMTAFYKNVLPYADKLVTPSVAMSQLIRELWVGDVVEIPDPCEIDPQKPRLPGLPPWRALWFGSCTNIQYLIHFLEQSLNVTPLRQLKVVTDSVGSRLLQEWVKLHRATISLPRIDIFPWSLANLQDAAAGSDIVVIPSDVNDPRKAGVSENRLVTAIQLGLVPVASPMRSYLRFEKYFVRVSPIWPSVVVHRNLSHLNELKKFNSIIDEFSRPAITRHWVTLLAQLATNSSKEYLTQSGK